MLRSEAVARINQGLGFRPAGNSLEEAIVSMLQEAQRDLEAGKTLPKFLIQEDQPIVLPAGQHAVSYGIQRFLRDDDEVPIHFYPPNATRPKFLSRKFYKDAVLSNLHATEASSVPDEPAAPSVYVLRRSTINFITTADQTYTLYWNYYQGAELLTSDIENDWLRSGAEWLIGEAGWRLAMDLGNSDAVMKFDRIRTAGRAAVFGDLLAFELSGGPLVMGANL